MDTLKPIVDALSALGKGFTWDLIWAFAAAGTISVATLQVIKELSPLREWFQKRHFELCIVCRATAFNKSLQTAQDTLVVKEDDAKKQVVELATGGLSSALYALPIEDMVAQINLAAPITLDSPVRYKALLAVLSEGVSFEDIEVVLKGQPASGSTQEYFDARGRVGRRIQRNLDGVRIAFGNRWKLWMQIVSLALCTVIVELALAATKCTDCGPYLLAVPIGIVGGYLAPITRDLLAALQQLRKP